MLAGLFAGALTDSVGLAATGWTTGRFVPGGVAALPGGACFTSGCVAATVVVRKV
jgi:hypothetical protein